MILSDRTIRQLLRQKTLGIQPLDDGQIQPASVDIRLGDTYSIAEETSAGIVYLDSEVRYRTIRAQSYLLLPAKRSHRLCRGPQLHRPAGPVHPKRRLGRPRL